MKTLRHCTIVSIIAFALVACTRNGDTAKVQLSIPTNSLSHQLSGAAPPPPLQTLIANVQIPGSPPLVQQMDFHDGSIPPASIVLTFANVPSGASLLVQVLAVYSASGGAMQLKYGDAPVVVNGDTNVTVSLTTAGGITKQSYLGGRVQLADTSFPTGTLVAMFQPPNNKPKMVVDQSAIVSGWFNVFAVNGTGITFDYYWKEGAQYVFTGLNPDLPTTSCTIGSLSGSCPFWVGSSPTDRVKIHKPASYSRTGNSSSGAGMQSNSEEEYVLGFFGNLSGTGQHVCYANDVLEAIPGLYASTDLPAAPWTTPLDINFQVLGTGTSTTSAEYMGGGSGATMAQLYTGGSSCPQSLIASGQALSLNHTLLGNNDQNFGGFQVPWMMVQPFASNNSQYMTVTPITNVGSAQTYSPATTTLNVNGLASAPIIGQAIWGPNIPMGTIITNVSGGPTPYVLTISLPTLNGGSGTTVSISPALTLSWLMMPGFTSGLSGISFTSASNSSLDQYIPGGNPPPPAGSFVLGGPFVGDTSITSVVPSAGDPGHFDFTYSQAANTTTATSVTASPVSGIELWAKFNLKVQGQLTNNSPIVTAVAPAYMAAVMVGMPVFGANIPQNAVISSVQPPSGFTMNVAATGTVTTNINIGTASDIVGGGHDDCSVLPSQGYLPIQTLAPTATSYSFIGTGGFPAPGPSVFYQFAACAAQNYSSGKTYLGSFIMGQPNVNSGDNGNSPFGWAHSSKTFSSGASVTLNAVLNISSVRLSAVTQAPSSGLTTLTNVGSNSFTSGDEILVTVAGMGPPGSCGNGVNVGNFAFARVLNANSLTITTIPAGTWVDQLLGANPAAFSTVANPATAFCYVQLTRVPQYRSVTLGGGGNLSIGAFNYGNSDLGTVAMRVNGSMSLAGNLYVNGEGFMGGYVSPGTTKKFAAGNSGMQTLSVITGGNAGGSGTTTGGGGGGSGNGDSGFDASTGQGSMGVSGWSFAYGGGGGGGVSGTDVGGNGGGTLFLAANNLNLTGNATISANGSNATANGGGGGGGSVNLITNSITSAAAYNLTIQALGGNAVGLGGAGGGGFVTALSCLTAATVTVSPPVVSHGLGTAHTSPASDGYQLTDLNGNGGMSYNKYWCE